jgi:hypothetical protein
MATMKFGRIAGNSSINAAISECFEHVDDRDARWLVRNFEQTANDEQQQSVLRRTGWPVQLQVPTMSDRSARVTVSVLLVCAVGLWVLIGALRETHSSEEYSLNTEHAKARRAFVKSVVVRPSILPLSDAVAYAVTDAWVEHPIRVRYRWYLFPKQAVDSSYRVVVHLAQVVRDSTAWTRDVGGLYVSGDVLLNGERVTTSGGSPTIVYRESATPFADSIRLSIRH